MGARGQFAAYTRQQPHASGLVDHMSKLISWVRRDLAGMHSFRAVLRWMRCRPAEVARVLAVMSLSGLIAFGFLMIIDRESWAPWFVMGTIMLVQGFVTPSDFSQYETQSLPLDERAERTDPP